MRSLAMLAAPVLLFGCKERSTPRPSRKDTTTPPLVTTPAPDAATEGIRTGAEAPHDLDDVYKDMVAIPEGWLQFTDTKARMYSFYIDRTEVTMAQYRACVDLGGCRAPYRHTAVSDGDPECVDDLGSWSMKDHDTHPITCIDAFDAHAYCLQAGKRLPTESEWEYAARGSDKRIFPWGDRAPRCDELAFRRQMDDTYCTKPQTRPVGTSKLDTSPFGVLDMSANVSEYVLVEGIRHPPSREDKVWGTKGGGITSFNAHLKVDEAAYPNRPSQGVGFRCAAGGHPH